jgi:predicted RNA-binding Zn-ribbon protein involved in translation (DUF1610 family)
MDAAMVARKFYCHKCGQRLINHPRTRLIKRGDPDYREHSSAGRIGHTHLIGDVELTEYDFKCPSCNRIIDPDEQYVIEKIQKMVGRHIITAEEYFAHEQAARLAIEKKKNTTNIVVMLIAIIGTIIAIYYAAKTGNFSFKFYF